MVELELFVADKNIILKKGVRRSEKRYIIIVLSAEPFLKTHMNLMLY